MAWTDDPLADFHRHDQEREDWLAKRPVCCECDEPIQTDYCFEFNDELICFDCLKENHRKWVDDCIE